MVSYTTSFRWRLTSPSSAIFLRGIFVGILSCIVVVFVILSTAPKLISRTSKNGLFFDDSEDEEFKAPFYASEKLKLSHYKPISERPLDAHQEAETLNVKSGGRESPYHIGLHDENCNKWRQDRINIHFIPHSHDDVGWLKTVDQYYWGSEQQIQQAAVQYTIDSVISEVARQPDRRFVIVEMAFLYRWWRRQNEVSRNLLRRLLERGQIELICAGWSMADEAATDYVSLIDQHTTGFHFITEEIDPAYRPAIAWQIDPFGHSREFASLSAEMGMNGLFFSRLDYQDREQRQMERTTEMVWQLRPQTPELGLSMFTSILPRANYMPPPWYNFDPSSNDVPLRDDPWLDEYNLDERLKNLETSMFIQKSQFPSNHLFVTMGLDFAYVNSVPWFSNMDVAIRHINNRSQTFHALYSTPSCYTRAVFESVKALTNKTGDFFPYADRPQAFWTGYFTSRPALKKLVRDVTNWLGTAKQLLALRETPIDAEFNELLLVAKDAQGILQHHDAVTGTAKQSVTNDYRKRGSIALKNCRQMISQSLREIHCSLAFSDCHLRRDDALEFCQFLNETQCPFTESTSKFSVIIHNPLAQASSSWIRLPFSTNENGRVAVWDPNGETVKADLIPVGDTLKSIPNRDSKATHELVFKAQLPPLGSSIYFVGLAENDQDNKAKIVEFKQFSANITAKGGSVKLENNVIDNGKLKVTLDDKGQIKSLENVEENVKADFKLYLAHYSSRGMPSPPSGAYLFNPGSVESQKLRQAEVSLVIGQQVLELHNKFPQDKWAKLIIRIFANETALELQWVVGPLANNQEVITLYESSISNENTFYTDSNGREMLKRKKDERESWNLQTTSPVSQNYYPLNSRIFVNDSKAQMTVIIDRAEGGSSLKDGQIEIMVHRRLSQDDQLGVGEALQEVENGKALVVSGKHWIMLNAPKKAAANYRKISQQVMFPPTVAFSATPKEDWLKFELKTVTSLGRALKADPLKTNLLPANVHLLSLERDFAYRCSLLVRLEHLFQGGEDEKLAKPEKVELLKFVEALLGPKVPRHRIVIEERALGANMPLKELVRLKWATTNEKPIKREESNRFEAPPDVKLQFDWLGERIERDFTDDGDSSYLKKQYLTMLPMQIRTFCVYVKD